MTAVEQSIEQKTMRARELKITAPRGQKTATIRALREAGCSVRADGTGRWDPDRERRYAPRPNQAALVELAQAGQVRIQPAGQSRYAYRVRYVDENPARLKPLTAARAASVLSRERLMSAAYHAYGTRVKPYSISAADVVEAILDRVGPAGEQARADEARYFAQFDRQQYESRKHSGRDFRQISRAVIASDESAAILSFVETGSYLHKGQTWDNYDPDFDSPPGGLHHLRIRVFLVVRDATSGERHVLRIPPRFGSTRSATWKRYVDDRGCGNTDGLIHAAVAWTFGLKPEEYSPAIES